ncbi:sulfurtransferase [Flammeovirga pacifica]|uniref:Rhodanese domain-containing protein n=1 Tax=Flammeovirga pacifica TaxID=915059 RepID=A0A1S1YT71_FLAPC|nr:sulfurtransferase [Flammeovirga pacifica]OHX64234.1 hypothetical protein NH26_21775 [Flammeovirga pacifica]
MKNILTVQEAFELSQKDNVIILDASQDGSKVGMTAQHPDLMIEGARLFDIKDVFSDTTSPLPNMFPSEEHFNKNAQDLGINNKDHILIYDNLGIFTSPRAWWMFNVMSHDQVSVINGGLDAWISAGYPTEARLQHTFEKGDFKGKKKDKNIVDADFIREDIHTFSHQIIDARGKGRFDGSIEEPRVGMRSGHIPGAKNIPFKNLLIDGQYKSKEERKEVFDSLQLDKNKPIVFSCGSGITACVDLLGASDIIENELKIYDGSWTEWGASDWPIE